MTRGDAGKDPEPSDLLPLTPAVFHILLALTSEERHGYGIMQEVDKLTNAQVHLGPGTLYRSIQRMLVDRLIEERKEPSENDDDDERRRYYRLTTFGLNVARAEALRLETLVSACRERGLLPREKSPDRPPSPKGRRAEK
jgi:DNA-binding PadR family transcriptional regulator